MTTLISTHWRIGSYLTWCRRDVREYPTLSTSARIDEITCGECKREVVRPFILPGGEVAYYGSDTERGIYVVKTS